MSSFGEDLRMERLSRGIALTDITAVTKINHQYLEALEQERFCVLPGGIINKGIIRSYAGAVGLNPSIWTERFVRAYAASGQTMDEDRGWIEFATNVGKERIIRSRAMKLRRLLRMVILILVLATGSGLGYRYYGLQAGWWPTLLPVQQTSASVQSLLDRVLP